jgi:hypothetical protein
MVPWLRAMNTTPTKDINVHEYPEGADNRTLLAYRIAVMQAFLDGKKIEGADSFCTNWRPIASPVWDWIAYRYRVAKPEPVKPGRYRLKGGFTMSGVDYVELDSAGNWACVMPDGRRTPVGTALVPIYERFVRDGTWLPVLGPKPRYFRHKTGLFPNRPGAPREYCVEIVAPDTTTLVYLDGTRKPREGVYSRWSIEEAERAVKSGNWVEFDGDMEPFKPQPAPVPAPEEKLSAKILRLLGELPEKYRVQAQSAFYAAPLTLRDYEQLADRIQTPADAVLYGFFWNRTGEGWSFWNSVEVEVRSK